MKPYSVVAIFIMWTVAVFFVGRLTVPPEEIEIVRVDTTTVTEVKVDTFYTPKDTVYASLPVPSPDTIEVETETSLPVLRYTRTYQDSLLRLTLTAYVRGMLQSWDIDYTPSFPEIRTVETITNTITVTERVIPRGFLSVGGEFRLPFEGAPFGVNPLVKYSFSSRQSIFYKYDTDPNSLGKHYIGFTYPIRFRL